MMDKVYLVHHVNVIIRRATFCQRSMRDRKSIDVVEQGEAVAYESDVFPQLHALDAQQLRDLTELGKFLTQPPRVQDQLNTLLA
jgi:hypothetical protein